MKYLLILLALFAVTMAAGRWVFRLSLQEQAIMAFTATFSNTVLLGILVVAVITTIGAVGTWVNGKWTALNAGINP